MSLIQTIELLSFHALPALETQHYDGWVLRFSNGYTRRANSVNPVYGSSLDIAEKIAQCGQLYHEHGLPLHFRLTDETYPADLDDLLAQRGFEQAGLTQVQTLDLSRITPVLADDVVINGQLTEAWLQDYWRLNDVAEAHHDTMRRMLHNITQPVACAALEVQGVTVAVCLGVYDDGYIGLYDIVTDAAYRRRGLGRRLVESLLYWGKAAHQAQTAYLQVLDSNEPARALYEKLGFEKVYQYWYRTQL